MDKESYMWLKINIQLQNEYCDGVTADLIKIIVSKGLWGAGKHLTSSAGNTKITIFSFLMKNYVEEKSDQGFRKPLVQRCVK